MSVNASVLDVGRWTAVHQDGSGQTRDPSPLNQKSLERNDLQLLLCAKVLSHLFIALPLICGPGSVLFLSSDL